MAQKAMQAVYMARPAEENTGAAVAIALMKGATLAARYSKMTIRS
jgi:hypothetical protein